jgi:hypothetical protein
MKIASPSDMFEFIHHPEYGCYNLKGLNALYIVSKLTEMEVDMSINLRFHYSLVQ